MVAEAAQAGARAASVAYDATELDATAAAAATRRLTTLGVDPAGAVIVMGFIPMLQSIHCRASVAYEDPGS